MKNCIYWMCSQWLLLSTFWSTLFISAGTPMTHKFIMTEVSSQLIAAKGLVLSIGTILVNSTFNRYGRCVYKFYRYFVLVEMLLYITLIPLIVNGCIPTWLYYVLTAVGDMIIARNIICCNNRMRRLIYKGEDRETHDNCRPIMQSTACIGGNLIACCGLPLSTSWWMVGIGVLLGDILFLVAYHKAPVDE